MQLRRPPSQGDYRYKIKAKPYGGSTGGRTANEMRKKNNYDSSNRYQRKIESDVWVRMRNYNGYRLYGTIDSAGYEKLRNHDGNTYLVMPC